MKTNLYEEGLILKFTNIGTLLKSNQSCAKNILYKFPSVLTQNEKAAIFRYKGGSSYIFNEYHRMQNSVDMPQYMKEMSADLSSALKKLPNYNRPTFRQIDIDRMSEDVSKKFMSEHKSGNIVEYPEFISSSKIENGYQVDSPKVGVFKIFGKTGKDISKYGSKEEQEVLFDKNSKFIVEHINDSAEKLYGILREVKKNE